MSNILRKHFPRSHAFIIGVNQYKNLGDLRNAVNDAKGVAKVLQEEVHDYSVYPPLLDATHAEITRLLDETIPTLVKEEDRLLFYFAGHGIARDSEQEGVPEGYLLPSDARIDDDAYSISMSKLRASLENLPCRHVFLVLDCCFSGAFRWSSMEKRAASFHSVPKKIYRERFDRYAIDPAWQVLTSSSHDQEAFDGIYNKPLGAGRNKGNTENSPFARHFIAALRGEADVIPGDQPDGLITATEVYLYIRDKLERETIAISEKARQTPGFFQLPRHDKGEYVFLSPKVALNLPHYDSRLNPYKGLQSYESADKNHFFGRDQVTEELFAFARSRKLVVVAGASGSGKSSLVKAGLIPRFAEEGFLTMTMRPEDKPLAQLKRLMPELQPDPACKSLLFIDQFEELITLCHQAAERKAFLEILHKLIQKTGDHFKLLISVRSDFEPQFEDGPLAVYWQEARFVAPSFSASELREIVERPAVERIILFDPPELADRIVREVQNAPGALPLLSFTMSEMYEQLKARGEFGAFKLEDYQSLGGVIGSLRTRADRLYNDLSTDAQLSMQKLMLRMISQEGGELARRRVLASELAYKDEAENERIMRVLNQLTDARLIVRGQDAKDRPYAEPAHDALVRAWGMLWSWITAVGKDKLLLLNKLHEATEEYQLTQNRKDLWHNNARLDAVNEEKERWLNASEINFVEKSLRRRKRNRNRLIAALTGVISILTVLVVVAFTQTRLAKDRLELANQKTEEAEESARKAKEQENIAIVAKDDAQRQRDTAQIERDIAKVERNNALIAQAKAELKARVSANSALALKTLKFDPTLALRIAAYAYKQDPGNPGAAAAFHDIISNRENNFYKLSLDAHADEVKSVCFSPDGRYFLSGSKDGTARLWDMDGKLIRAFSGKLGEVNAAIFSPDGRHILTGSKDRTAKLWDLKGNIIQTFSGHRGGVNAVAFSPDGRYILTGSQDKTAKLWSTDGKVFQTFSGHGLFWVNSVDFSPDGQYVLTASNNKKAQLWDLDGNIVQSFSGHLQNVNSAVFSPDGRYILTGSDDQTAKLWRVDGKLMHTFSENLDKVNSAIFSPDGQSTLTASDDVRQWRLDGGLIRTFRNKHNVKAVALSPDGRYALSGSWDQTLKLWTVDANPALSISIDSSWVYAVDFSPNGKSLLTVSHGPSFGPDEKAVSFWDLNGKRLDSFPPWRDKGNRFSFPDTRGVSFAIFSPDGRSFATASQDNIVKLWDLDGKLLQTFSGCLNDVNSVAFSPNGQYLLAGSDDNTAVLWTIKGKTLRAFEHNDDVNAVAFSPNGQFIATGSSDQTVKLWSLDGQLIQSFFGDHGDIQAVAFSPDGRRLLAAGVFTAKLWSLDGTLVHTLAGHNSNLTSAAFSQDGRYILTGSFDKTARLWDAYGNLLWTLYGHDYFVSSVAFSPEGRFLFTGGSKDGTARLWLGKETFLAQTVADLPLEQLLFEGLQVEEKGLKRYWDRSNEEKKESIAAYYFYSRDWEKAESAYFLLWNQYRRIEYLIELIKIHNNQNKSLVLNEKTWTSLLKKGRPDELIKLGDLFFAISDWKSARRLYAHLWKTNKSAEAWTKMAELGIVDPALFEPRLANELQAQQMDSIYMLFEFFHTNSLANDGPNRELPLFKEAFLLTNMETNKNFRDLVGNVLKINRTKAEARHYANLALQIADLLVDWKAPVRNTEQAAHIYNNIGWYHLENGRPKKGEQAIRRGLESAPEDQYLLSNLAPALLLQGVRFDEAKKAYKKWMNEKFTADDWQFYNKRETFREVFLQDLELLEEAGAITAQVREKVEEVKIMLEDESK